jgi:hypothetical protein
MEHRRVYIQEVADAYHLDREHEDPDPHLSKMLNPDAH